MITPGIFTISLDFELHWGVFDKRERNARMRCYENTRQLIPALLRSFEEHGVHVTWASVGSLFVSNDVQWKLVSPVSQPSYTDKSISAYEYVKANGVQQYEQAHFAPELIAMISKYEGQELATHTFSHYYCLENGQTPEQFGADLKIAQQLADDMGEKMISLVFPRNQFNDQYLSVCWDHGIKVVRSNPVDWYWTGISDKATSFIRQLFRTGDAFFPLGKKTYPLSAISVVKGRPLMVPASRLLRAYHPRFAFLNRLRLRRILREMTYAAKHNECYHLWWHPENFGDHPQQNMKDLSVILRHFVSLQKRYGMMSWNMAEYWKYLGDNYGETKKDTAGKDHDDPVIASVVDHRAA